MLIGPLLTADPLNTNHTEDIMTRYPDPRDTQRLNHQLALADKLNADLHNQALHGAYITLARQSLTLITDNRKEN